MIHTPQPSLPQDRDPELEALLEELRAVRASLNAEHHPVNPGDPDRIAAFEQRMAELRDTIATRRAALREAHAGA